MQIKLHALAFGLIVAGFSSAATADSNYYDPTNNAPGNDSGKTVGYQLYSTIGCPGKQLLDPGCPAETTESEPVTASLPEPTPAPASASLSAPAPITAPAPVQIAKAEPSTLNNRANTFCNFYPQTYGQNPYLSYK